MGRRGPKPTPTAELAARGSWLADTRKGEPEPAAGVPDPPPDMHGEARAYWFRLWPHLTSMHIASPLYREKAIALCRTWDALERTWQQFDACTEVEDVQRVGCLLNKLLTQFNRYAADFGLSPADKTRVRMEKPTGGQDNRAQKFGLAG